MAPRPPVPNVLKADFWMTLIGGGLSSHNILHVSNASDISIADMQLLANRLEANFQTDFTAYIAPQWRFQSCTLTKLNGTGVQAISSTPTALGTSGGTSLPPQCAVAISWQIARSYRGGKPRSYLAGVPSIAQVAGYGPGLDHGWCSALANQASIFRNYVAGETTASGGACALGTVSYMSGKVARPSPLFEPYVGERVHERLDSQRRRSGKESSYGFDVGP